MSPERFRDFVTNVLEDSKTLMGDKNAEYARSTDDKLANFKRRAAHIGIDPLTVLLVDVDKHMDAIHSFVSKVRNGQTIAVNDPIARRAKDVLVYMILFQAIVEDLGVQETLTQTGQHEHYIAPNHTVGEILMVNDVTKTPLCRNGYWKASNTKLGVAICSVCEKTHDIL